MNTIFKESKDAYMASIDMPGIKASDIDIHVRDKYINIMAERKDSLDDDETVYRKYSQQFTIPLNTDPGKIESHYENGVLTLVFPKLDKVELSGKKVEVLTGEKPKKWLSLFNKDEEENKEKNEKSKETKH
jgi:HSP20 family protein